MIKILICIFAIIGMVYTCTKVAGAISWVFKYRETIEAYAKLMNNNKEKNADRKRNLQNCR